MADNSQGRPPLPQVLRPGPMDNVRDGIRSSTELPPSVMKSITQRYLNDPTLTPWQRAQYEDVMKNVKLYEWDKDAPRRGLSEIAKYAYMPEFTGYFSNTYENLTPRQIESEYSTLFDDTVNRNGGLRPYDFDDFYYRLKERLDANSGVRGERLDMGKGNKLDRGKGDRLDVNTLGNSSPQLSNKKALVRALLNAQQRRPTYGPR